MTCVLHQFAGAANKRGEIENGITHDLSNDTESGDEALASLSAEHDCDYGDCGASSATALALFQAALHFMTQSTFYLSAIWMRMPVPSALDFRLGARMLRRYPGLSIIGGLALAFAIAIGVLAFQLAHNQLTPALPLDHGERVVRLENFDRILSAPEPHALYDFQRWRETLKSVEQLGAAQSVDRNLIRPGRPPLSIPVAEMTPSGFAVTRVQPFRGRPIIDADAIPGAPDVAVIGYELWQNQFGGDPTIVGKPIQLGATIATVVGIMPKGFGFPRYQQAWLPLRDIARSAGDGPPVLVFGRLAPGATLVSAQTEMQTVSARLTLDDSASRKHLQPRVVPFANTVLPVATSTVMFAMFVGVFLVLLGISANVATLMFARTALRETEIVVRTALGASRGRIIMQLLTESLVLSGVATVVGLLIARGVLQFIWYQQTVVRQVPQPFWSNQGLALGTVLWAIVLAFIGAVLVGLLPGIKATRASVRDALARTHANASGMRFGGVWSFVIVAQVAFSVLALPVAIGTTREMNRKHGERTFRPAEFLTFETQFDETGGPRLDAAYDELERRLLNEPSVAAVTRGSGPPGMGYRSRRIEMQRGTENPALVRGNMEGAVFSARVALNFFDVFALPMVAGRAFNASDVSAHTVIINQALAKRLGGNPLGTRIRDEARQVADGVDGAPEPWYEVVGVVTNTEMVPTDSGEADMMYQTVPASQLNPGYFAVHVRGNPGSLAARVPQIALEVNPSLRVYRALPYDEVLRKAALPGYMSYAGVLSVIALAIVLSAAGLFALMSVSVQRRTREIGIRVALGADSRGVLRALFSRAALQLGIGIVVGNVLVFGTKSLAGPINLSSLVPPMLGISVLMLLVGVGACAVPARRALKVHPTEAIKGVI